MRFSGELKKTEKAGRRMFCTSYETANFKSAAVLAGLKTADDCSPLEEGVVVARKVTCV